MRAESRIIEGSEIPIPDIERLFIDVLQLSQGRQNAIALFGNRILHKHPEWQRRYSAQQLSERTESQIVNIVQGVGHRKTPYSVKEIKRIVWSDAHTFLEALEYSYKSTDPKELASEIIIGDFLALGDVKGRFAGRSRREAPEGMPMTPQRDPWQSIVIFYFVMTPKEREKVHESGYNLHPALEEICDETRSYIKELCQKKNRDGEEEELYQSLRRLEAMWNEHHPHAQVSLG